jgi:hypothetical protein
MHNNLIVNRTYDLSFRATEAVIPCESCVHCVRYVCPIKMTINYTEGSVLMLVTPCRLVEIHQPFGEPYCFHLQGIIVLKPNRWKQYVLQRRRNILTSLLRHIPESGHPHCHRHEHLKNLANKTCFILRNFHFWEIRVL